MRTDESPDHFVVEDIARLEGLEPTVIQALAGLRISGDDALTELRGMVEDGFVLETEMGRYRMSDAGVKRGRIWARFDKEK